MIGRLFSAMAVILIGCFAVSYWAGQRVLTRMAQLEEIRGRLAELDDVLSTLKDAETGQRGYLLTSNDSYLTPYRSAQERIEGDLRSLRSLPPGELATLQDLVKKKLGELEHTILLADQGRRDEALGVVASNVGRELMDSIRGLIATMVARQEAEATTARNAATQATYLRTGVFAGSLLLCILFLLWAYRRILGEVARRTAADAVAQREKDLLAVTLKSIGDAVIVTDPTARILYMNPMAEKLTGWSSAQSVGQPCGEVFKIINEETRAHVDSPVERVLATGAIVGLANHTVLIRKNGSEIPIDDSGAPVREPGGVIRGVVLVFRDFSAQKQNEQTLRRAKEELEAAAKSKDLFLAMLSHELRTPLTPVLATLSLWELANEPPASFADDVRMLKRNIELEARLIDDLLDLTRIVKGKVGLMPDLCDLHDLISEVLRAHESDILAGRVSLKTALDAGQHIVLADHARMQQVFSNLIRNAVKYTPAGGRITVKTENDATGHIVVSFTDTGIGIRPELIERVFRPFEQGSDDRGRRFGGLGLGLAISKSLVDAHGGTLTAASDGAGQGSRFEVRLLSVNAAPARNDPADPLPRAEGRRRRILVVEDHADSALMVRRMLETLGHDATVCESVEEARQKIATETFDLVISDIGLPDGTGLDVIRYVRARHVWPAIALTGFGMEEDVRQYRESGFNAHLTKPVTIQKIEAAVRAVLK